MHHFQIFKGSLNAFPMNLQPFISKSVLYSLESQEYSQLQGFKFYSRAKLEIRMMCRNCRLKENQNRPETEVPSGQKVRRWKFLKYKLNGDAEFVEFVNGRRILFFSSDSWNFSSSFCELFIDHHNQISILENGHRKSGLSITPNKKRSFCGIK